MHVEGIYTPVITPLHADDSVDYDGFRSLTDHLIDVGVHGVVIGGITGAYSPRPPPSARDRGRARAAGWSWQPHHL